MEEGKPVSFCKIGKDKGTGRQKRERETLKGQSLQRDTACGVAYDV